MLIKSAKEFGALVRSEREKRGWSQSLLAERVGVSLPWISQFERGKPTARIDLVLKTLKTLGIPLWAGEPPMAPSPKASVVNLDELLNRPSSPSPPKK
ncbi:MAG: helix-turn-helix transcriptional regulator [Verrucomicrobiae bacterium]|nr:helix-turn-helix transcriptional regulator [Verrucomicrobiae bacterium]MCB1091378.1 helix-turn-helix transcriptional regulator [Verrucomicrobiae bacterium]